MDADVHQFHMYCSTQHKNTHAPHHHPLIHHRTTTTSKNTTTTSKNTTTNNKNNLAAFVKTLGRQRINRMFTQLRKVAQHPLLVRALVTDATLDTIITTAARRRVFGPDAREPVVREELSTYNDAQLDMLAKTHPTLFPTVALDPSVYEDSGKVAVLKTLLPRLKREGSRPLIFSQWTSVLDLLEVVLQGMGLTYVRLDGSTAVADRMELVDRFNAQDSGIFAFLLSTRAGGQGLNLTGADTVVIHDVDFNPSVDRQAEDRCHRIGQTRPVRVYRLVTQGTVDWGIYEQAQHKTRYTCVGGYVGVCCGGLWCVYVCVLVNAHW